MSDRLFAEAWRFDFFQAVRLLSHPARTREQASVGQTTSGQANLGQSVGRDAAPDTEAVRFKTWTSKAFPAGDIHKLTQAEADPERGRRTAPPPEMSVTFMGLIGAHGALPDHYTTLLIERVRQRDFAFRDFLDLFHHRTLSLFYRAWEKYRFPFNIERLGVDPPEEDLFTQCLAAFVGIGTSKLRDRSDHDDQVYLHYAGLFAQQPRSTVALERLLAEYFELPVRVAQYQGQWLRLAREDRSRLGGTENPGGQFNRLGVNSVLGERIWDVQSKFRLLVGPLDRRQFESLLPSGGRLRQLMQLTRSYAGMEFDFDVQLILQPAEVPPCRLRAKGTEGGRLGWNTWLAARDYGETVHDAVFAAAE